MWNLPKLYISPHYNCFNFALYWFCLVLPVAMIIDQRFIIRCFAAKSLKNKPTDWVCIHGKCSQATSNANSIGQANSNPIAHVNTKWIEKLNSSQTKMKNFIKYFLSQIEYEVLKNNNKERNMQSAQHTHALTNFGMTWVFRFMYFIIFS